MFSRFASATIGTKLALVMTVLIGLISLAIYIYVPRQLRDQANRSIAEEAFHITDMAAFSISPGLRSRERGEIAEALWNLRENNQLAYLLVFDKEGRLVASFNEKLANRYRSNIPMERQQDPHTRKGKTIYAAGGFSADREIYQTHSPVLHRGESLGSIYVGFSLGAVHAEIAAARRGLALLSLVIFIMGVGGAVAMSTAITGPLQRIVETVEQIAAGDLSKRARVSHDNEVGQLAKSFNTMVGRLQNAQQELAGLNEGLERRIDDRTRELRDEVVERRRAESALKASEERYRSLFERNLSGVYIKGLDRRILDCNEAFARMLGYDSRKEFLADGGSVKYFDRADEQKLLELLFNRGSVMNYEVRLLARDGDVIWAMENVTLSSGEIPVLEGVVLDITDRKRSEQEIEYQAYHDGLTGLANRTLFRDRLSVSLSVARRQTHGVAVMFLDLDDLKVVNDTLGHDLGDQLLQRVGERLTESLRQEDTVARVGGDEFTILLPHVKNEAEAAAVARHIVKVFSDPFVLGEDEIHVRASIGVALYPADGEDPETLLSNADRTMYAVKSGGGNGFQFCSHKSVPRGPGRFTLEQSLRYALERDEFAVHYQPQVDMSTQEIVGVEALVRWNHPDGMMVEPSRFIALAEYTGLIVPIGEQVLLRACQQAHQWHQERGQIRVGVNVSARQFHQRGFLGMIRRALEQTRIRPDLLELEITESVAMQTSEWTISMLRQLKELGVSIAMDDFGTGQSSLSQLKRFPIDTVKIDQSFVRDVQDPSSEAPIMSAILLLCHSLKLRTVAEGVETAAQYEFLRRSQCCEMQGYFFSPAVTAETMVGLLNSPASLPTSHLPDSTS